jgi:hypothetical protein
LICGYAVFRLVWQINSANAVIENLNPPGSAAIYLFSLEYYNFVNELSVGDDTDRADRQATTGGYNQPMDICCDF